MTSYLRSIFGGYSSQPTPVHTGHSSRSSSSHRSKSHSHSSSHSHSRSHSVPSVNPAHANYIYASTPSATSSHSHSHSHSRPVHKRSQSFSGVRSTAPSPLRYGSYDSSAGYPSSDGHGHKRQRSPLYRRASYKGSEPAGPVPYPASSGYASSRSNSSSSILPGMGTTRSTTSSRSRRPVLSRSNHTWHGSQASSVGTATPSHAALNLHAQSSRPSGSIHMHPLLAATRLHSAPISYDILYTPSTRTVIDRTTHMAVPPHTLSQPATDPPTPITSRIVLRSDKFPWPVVVGPSSSSKSGSRFYLGSSDKNSRSAITNLDLLYALHTTLLTRVTPQEWESLGNGSRAQKKVTQAYEKRCKRMGGGWEGGVRRIDWLHGKTRLVGIEVDKYGQGQGMGKLVFSKA